MNFNKIVLVLLAAVFAIAALPAAMAYNAYYPQPYYGAYGTSRMGAYTSTWPYAQGMYNYVSPPVSLVRYGADYNIYNIRDAVYPNYGFARVPNIYRPYYGYPYRTYGTWPYTHYQSYSGGWSPPGLPCPPGLPGLPHL